MVSASPSTRLTGPFDKFFPAYLDALAAADWPIDVVAIHTYPILNDKGEMSGSLVILEVGSKAEAEAWAAADPYAKAGLFAKVRIEEWKKVIG